MECSSETLAQLYQTTRRHILKTVTFVSPELSRHTILVSKIISKQNIVPVQFLEDKTYKDSTIGFSHRRCTRNRTLRYNGTLL